MKDGCDMKMRTSVTHRMGIDELRIENLPGVIGLTFCPVKIQRNGWTGACRIIPVLMSLIACDLSAGEVMAVPLVKNGSCPSGYSSSGNYCAPGSSAMFAVEKRGSCPSGYSSSGNYCLASKNAKLAVQKVGSCPSGYSSSGDYCLSSK